MNTSPGFLRIIAPAMVFERSDHYDQPERASPEKDAGNAQKP